MHKLRCLSMQWKSYFNTLQGEKPFCFHITFDAALGQLVWSWFAVKLLRGLHPPFTPHINSNYKNDGYTEKVQQINICLVNQFVLWCFPMYVTFCKSKTVKCFPKHSVFKTWNYLWFHLCEQCMVLNWYPCTSMPLFSFSRFGTTSIVKGTLLKGDVTNS